MTLGNNCLIIMHTHSKDSLSITQIIGGEDEWIQICDHCVTNTLTQALV